MYYLQSRYYDPTTMRFINADDPNIIQMGTEEKQELNLYAYCLNDPVNYVDYNGFQAGTLFNSESSAVRDFAVCYYAISLYIRMELSVLVYKTTTGKYGYTLYIIGDPHSCRPLDGKSKIPSKSKLVSAVHTHPNSNNFSDADKKFSRINNITLWVITPNRKIRSYSKKGTQYYDRIIWAYFSTNPISPSLKYQLKRDYYGKWKSHTMSVCAFGCSRLVWPNY